MKNKIKRLFTSLTARIIILLVGVQIALFIIVGFVENQSIREGEQSYPFGIDEAYSTFMLIYSDLGLEEDDVYLASQYADAILLWDDIKVKNPEFNFYFKNGDYEELQGTAPTVLPTLIEGVAAVTPPESRCISLNFSGLNHIAVARVCFDGSFEYSEFSGLSDVYKPLNYSFLPVRNWKNKLLTTFFTFLPVMLLTPILIWLFIRPIRKAAQVAATISPLERGYQLPTRGVAIEARGFIDAINASLKRLDIGHVRERKFRDAIAHELRTPLTVLRARLEEIENQPRREQLIKDTRRIRNLVNRLLEFARASSDAIEFEELDLGVVLQEACAHCGAAAIEADIDISFSSLPTTPMVFTNKVGLFIALTNLLHNAIEHSETLQPIKARIVNKGSIEIEDFGVGFDGIDGWLDLHAADPDLYKELLGNGLGLSIAIQAVELCGGKLSLRSQKNYGACFKVDL